ncbi:hypothetical protein [Isoptericola sp. 178]|uniref:hypothetical protein n=1 Tax=Isoptericola sp. 178 TaxID=3064651 RepID=UPI00271379C7|nr:hypothetical protein [Isoptericola sp. 178]MDO8145103.1 hypothetical protein [Isoptericola sp. 178]
MPVMTHLLSEDAWELDKEASDNLAVFMESAFGSEVKSWAPVVHAFVRALDQRISKAALREAADVASYLGEDQAADFLNLMVRSPGLMEEVLQSQMAHHGEFIALGRFVRRKAAVRDGRDVRPGRWHLSTCRFVARAGAVANWEGVEELPGVGGVCGECRAGQPPTPAERPHAEQDLARDSMRDEIANLGAFVRRRGEVDFPPGKWHAVGCRTTRAATDVRMWQGAGEFPAGDDACKTCLPGQ